MRRDPYGAITAGAVERLLTGAHATPDRAWDAAAEELYPAAVDRRDPREKGCSREAFIGLCERGWVAGVARSEEPTDGPNGFYAAEGVKYLQQHCANGQPLPTPAELWEKLRGVVPGLPKNYNGQMSVVLALWPKSIRRARVGDSNAAPTRAAESEARKS